jgi:hypothetical protein
MAGQDGYGHAMNWLPALLVSAVTLLAPASAAALERPVQYGPKGLPTAGLVPASLAAIPVIQERCPQADASASCTYPGGPIYLGPGDNRDALLHEYGHHVDYLLMTDADRARFMRLRGLEGGWRQAPNSPHEQFAEAAGMCMSGPFRVGWRTHARVNGGYEYRPTRRRHARICRLIRTVVG